jgi:drug/metabolite transporter (DMT)-like permease
MKGKIGYVYLCITFFCWGSIYIVAKYALAEMGPITVSLCRYLVSVICLAIILKIKGSRKPVKKEHWKYIFVVGAIGYFVSIACQLAGTNLLNSSLASLINAMNPITISILAAILLKEKIRKKNIVSILISLVGVYIILGIGDGGISTLGVILSVLSVVFWSGASIAIRKISSEYDPVQTALYGMCIALVLNIPAAAAENVFVVQSTVTKEAAFACIYLGIFGTAVAHTCWNKGLQLLDASTCSMFYPMQPLASAVLGVLILHEVLTWNFIAGGLVICVGILITVMPERRKKNADSGRFKKSIK